ncbi:MAG: substrate-binding domain-containing protein [Phycisphaerae bacterium]|nr:substrate-binding domain-containing protein [Phycisphaerae bacterium]
MKRPGNIVWIAVISVAAAAFMVYVFVKPLGFDTPLEPPAHARTKELILYCGAGIQPVAEALSQAFSKTSGIVVNTTYAGSGRLLGQLAASQVGDLFMPGSAFYVDSAIERKLAYANTLKKVAYFVPVIAVPKGNPDQVTSLRDLAEKPLRVGLGDERAVAVGKHATKLFEKNQIPYADVVKHVVMRSGTVNELGVALQMKHIDAAIMWDANARQFASAVDRVDIPTEQNLVSTIPVVVLTCTQSFDDAKAFVDFITSPVGQDILRAYHYTVELAH